MNQILNTKKQERIKKLFLIQFRISILCIIFGVIYLIRNIKMKEKENNISNIISLNARLNYIFNDSVDESANNEIYAGRIICDKINLDYFIYNEYSESNLKVLPCKFSGKKFGEDGNICIIAHNYFDDRFFSNIDKLNKNDEIKIEDLKGNIYRYFVYDKYEIDESETENVLEAKEKQEITLFTCTFKKEKRLVIRAKCN